MHLLSSSQLFLCVVLSLTTPSALRLSFSLSLPLSFYPSSRIFLNNIHAKVKCLYDMTIKIPCMESAYYVSPQTDVYTLDQRCTQTHTMPHDLLNLITYTLYLHREYIDICVCMCVYCVRAYIRMYHYEKRKKGTKWAACKCKLSVEKKIASRKNKYTFW